MKNLFFCLAAIFFTGCGVSRQIKEAQTFAKCEFRLQSVEELHLAGVNIQKIKSVTDLILKKSAELMFSQYVSST